MIAAYRGIKRGDNVLLIEKGKSVIDRLIEFKGQQACFSPFGEGGRVFFNFKTFSIAKPKYLEIRVLFQQLNISINNDLVTIKEMTALIKQLHFYIQEHGTVYYETVVTGFQERCGEILAVEIGQGEVIAGDQFIFAFGNLDRILYAQLWKMGVALTPLNIYLPLKISIPKSDSALNTFFKDKPIVAFNRRAFFFDEYQDQTRIVPVEINPGFYSCENLAYNRAGVGEININLNLALKRNEITDFDRSSLHNLSFLSLLEQKQGKLRKHLNASLKTFPEHKGYQAILGDEVVQLFHRALIHFFEGFGDDLMARIVIHGISTISLRPIQVTTNQDGYSITLTNVQVVGNAKADFEGLRGKLLDALGIFH